MPPVTGESQHGGKEAADVASHEKGRPPDEIYEDDKMETSSRRFPPASVSKSTKISDEDSEQLGPLAPQKEKRKGKRKLDSEDIYPHYPQSEAQETVDEKTAVVSDAAVTWSVVRCAITEPHHDSWADSTADVLALDEMEIGKEKYPIRESGKLKHNFQEQRAWLVHDIWASIENVREISSSLLVNKLQCEHIADHFEVIGDVLKKLGLGKDFVSSQALESGTGIQTVLSFDEALFDHIADTFDSERHSYFRTTRSEDSSREFLEYILELDGQVGSSKDSLFKKLNIFKGSEGSQNYTLQRMSMKEIVETRFGYQMQHRLGGFLYLLFEVLKYGEDLVLFHLGLEGANNGVVERTGLYGEKFVQIHEFLYKLLDCYACLKHCEDTEFARGHWYAEDSCRAQSLLYYLNSNCLGESTSLSIDGNSLNVELATTLSELLERPNCVLKALHITPSSMFKINCEELWKCRLLVIAALSKCVSMTSLTVRASNGEEVHELCKSLRANRVLKNLDISIDGPLNDDHAMAVSAMLKENHSLKSFTLEFKGISSEGAAYLGAMLAENSSLEKLSLRCWAWNEIGMRHIMWPLMANNDGESQVNSSLKDLHIGNIDKCPLEVAQLLLTNKTLTHFSIEGMDLDPGAACKIADSLKKNRTLQVLDLQGWSSFSNDSEVATCLEAVLAENSTLEELKVDMDMLDRFCLKYLLRPLMAKKDGEPHVNISLKQLHILNYDGGKDQGLEVVKSIAQILRTNKTLSHFSMTDAFVEPSDVCEILDSLKINKDLQVLNLDKCSGLDNPEVKVAFMDLLVNYNFTLRTIKMHGRDWDIEAFMKSVLEPVGSIWNIASVIPKSPTMHNAYEFKEAFEEQGDLIVGHPSELEVILDDSTSNLAKAEVASRLRNKLEMESQRSLQELKPSLESIMKSTNLLLRRNLNMAQFLQERYSEWNLFEEMYPSKLTDEEKDEFNKGHIIAALFPTTFLYHLKVCLFEGPNLGGILYTLKEVANLVIQRMKSLQDFGRQIFQFIDYDDFQASVAVQHIYSLKETIAICQIFSTKVGIGEELQIENSIQHSLVRDHLTGVYCFDSVKSSNLDKPNIDKPIGVIGVKVKSIEIQVEIMWEDGSYYSGTLKDFSCNHKNHDNKQCAFEAFGHLEGAHFLETCGLKCSPLLVIALAMAIDKKGLTLTWNKGKGHIQSNSIHLSLQPTELEVWECQILFGGDINQLGEAIEWGMNQLDPNCASSSRDNQRQVFSSEYNPNQTFPISNDTSMDTWSFDESNDTSSDTPNKVDLTSQFSAGAQDKKKVSFELKLFGSGASISYEIQSSQGEDVQNQAYQKMKDLKGKEEGGFVIVGNLDVQHQRLKENLLLGSLSAEHDLNYLVVYDNRKPSYVSIYWVNEKSDQPKLELKWITEIFIEGGVERIKKIFEGLKGETLEVRRRYTKFHENPPPQPQSKGFMKWFKKHLSNKDSCKMNGLQMVSRLEGSLHPKFSNDEWKHIVGVQEFTPTKFWLMASYMQAITYSRTIYTSGVLLSTHTTEKYGLKCGSAQREFGCGPSMYVHKFEDVKSYAKFSKPPLSLSLKWHDMFNWGGFNEMV